MKYTINNAGPEPEGSTLPTKYIPTMFFFKNFNVPSDHFQRDSPTITFYSKFSYSSTDNSFIYKSNVWAGRIRRNRYAVTMWLAELTKIQPPVLSSVRSFTEIQGRTNCVFAVDCDRASGRLTTSPPGSYRDALRRTQNVCSSLVINHDTHKQESWSPHFRSIVRRP